MRKRSILQYFSLLFLLILQYGWAKAQVDNMIGLRFGSQQAIWSKRIASDSLSQSNFNSKIRQQRFNVEASYLHPLGAKQYLRFRAGVHLTAQKGLQSFLNPVNSNNLNTKSFRAGCILAFDIGRSIKFDKFLFQYGAGLSFAFAPPSQAHTTEESVHFPDSVYTRTEYRIYTPGVWGPGVGTFFCLQWNFAPHFYLGLEGQVSFGLRLLNDETKFTIDTYDRQGNLISHRAEVDSYSGFILGGSFWLSAPAILLNYRF